jgi:acetyl esterase/lipase
MDITYTPGETGPLLLEIHGGGWFSGDKADSGMAGFRAYFRSLGFVVVSMNYRLVNQGSPSTGAHFPEPINDVACALATLTQNAAFFGVNSRRVLFGHSSGGHLATLLALSPEGRNGSVWGDSTCGVSVSRQDLTVDGAIGSSPLFDLSLAPSGRDTDISNMLNLLNLGTDNFRNHPDVYLPASPIHYVNSFDAPIFAVIGGADGFINAPQQDAAMGPAMNAAGNFYDSIVVAGWSHNEFQLEMRTYNPAISPTGSLKTVLDRVYGYLADDLDVLTP